MHQPKWLLTVLGLAVVAGMGLRAAAQDAPVLSTDGQGVVIGSGASPAVAAPGGPMPSPSERPDSESKGDKTDEGKGKPEEKKGEADKDKAASEKEKEKKAEEEKGPEPIMRPSEPPAPPDPEQLKVRPGADGKIRFNFTGQRWQDVLQWLADVSGMSLDWQELPGDYLNLTTQRGYTLDETRDLVNRHLLARGYTLLRYAEVFSVVKLDKLNSGMVPRVEPEELDQRDPYEFVKVSFDLDWMLAETAAEELKPMLSAYGKLNPLKESNRLEAIDAVVNLREIRRLLAVEQSVEAEGRLFEEFTLKYAKAEDVREQLLGLLGIESKPKSTPPTSPHEMQQMQQMQQMQEEARRQAQQHQQPQKGGAPSKPAVPPQVNLVVNPRRNSILVNAPPDKMAIIRQAVEALDVPGGPEESLLLSMHRMQIYRLAAIDPEPLVKTLEALGDLDPRTRLEVDKENRAIIAYAPAADHVMIRALIDQLDGSGRSFEVIPLRRLPADYVAGTVQFMMSGEEEQKPRSSRYSYGYGSSRGETQKQEKDKFRVDADVERNRLLLWANEIEIEEVRVLLVKLGEIPPEGGNTSRVRVLEGSWGPETDEWLERVRRAWPSVAPNPLELPTEKPPKAEASKPEDKDKGEEKSPRQDTSAGDVRPPRNAPRRSFVQLAELRQEKADETTTETAGPVRGETSPLPPAGEGPGVRADVSKSPSKKPSPIQINRGPDGRLVITSEDTRALDLLEDLMTQLAPPRIDYKIFRLKYAWAYGVALTLEDVFKEEEKSSRPSYPWYWYDYDDRSDTQSGRLRLSKRRPLKFVADPDTNSILVQNANPDQLAKIDELIQFYDQPEPLDSQSVRKTKVFSLRYAQAATVADAVKDIYRDLLSANDKALTGHPQQQSSERTVYYFDVYGGSTDESKQQKAPRFKGLLSIGVNELSNTLVVSAPAFLLDDVSELIDELDEAASPTAETVQLVPIGNGVDIMQVQKKLSLMLGEGSTGSRRGRTPGSREAGRGGERTPQKSTHSETR